MKRHLFVIHLRILRVVQDIWLRIFSPRILVQPGAGYLARIFKLRILVQDICSGYLTQDIKLGYFNQDIPSPGYYYLTQDIFSRIFFTQDI
mgnify:CR=1 FL=1